MNLNVVTFHPHQCINECDLLLVLWIFLQAVSLLDMSQCKKVTSVFDVPLQEYPRQLQGDVSAGRRVWTVQRRSPQPDRPERGQVRRLPGDRHVVIKSRERGGEVRQSQHCPPEAGCLHK